MPIDTTIQKGERVVLVEDFVVPAGSAGVVVAVEKNRGRWLSHEVRFDSGRILLVPGKAIRLESEMPLTSAVSVVRRIAEQQASSVECDDFRDRLILACAAGFFTENWMDQRQWPEGILRMSRFADAVMAERAKGAK